MSQPLLFLDVDGPLNPFYARENERPAGYTAHEMTPSWLIRDPSAPATQVEPVVVWLNPDHGKSLLDLPFDLVWATTWMHEANEWIAPYLGLPELPHVPFSDVRAWLADGTSFKTRDIVTWTDGKPFAWIDDDITDADRAYVAAHHHSPALLHRIHPAKGLRAEDFALLADWATGIAANGVDTSCP